MGIGDEKVALRTRYRRERSERYLDHSFEFLAASDEFQKADVIASYFSYGDEPQTAQLNRAIIESGKTLLLPRIAGAEIEWVQWDGSENSLKTHKKINEPTGEIYLEWQKIDLIVVPALRIDRRGYRLGQGGGYYDRTLPKLNAWSIGLIHADEISSADLPHEDWDIPLNAAATPDLVIRFKR